MKLSEAVEAFLLSRVGVTSPATVAWYRKRLASLPVFLGGVDIGAISVHDLRRWRAALFERKTRYESHPYRRHPEPGGLSPFTLAGYVRAARVLFSWLEAEGLLSANPARRLEIPRVPKGQVKGIARDDVRRMFAAARETSARDFALVWFFYSTGARLSGAAGLLLSELHLGEGLAYVVEKGRKRRAVFLVPEAVQAMRAYLVDRQNVSALRVFLGVKGPLTGGGIYQVLRRLARMAGVDEDWNPHLWRHRRLRDLQAAGMPLGLVSQIAGHSSEHITADLYGRVGEDELERAFFEYAGRVSAGTPFVAAP